MAGATQTERLGNLATDKINVWWKGVNIVFRFRWVSNVDQSNLFCMWLMLWLLLQERKAVALGRSVKKWMFSTLSPVRRTPGKLLTYDFLVCWLFGSLQVIPHFGTSKQRGISNLNIRKFVVLQSCMRTYTPLWNGRTYSEGPSKSCTTPETGKQPKCLF